MAFSSALLTYYKCIMLSTFSTLLNEWLPLYIYETNVSGEQFSHSNRHYLVSTVPSSISVTQNCLTARNSGHHSGQWQDALNPRNVLESIKFQHILLFTDAMFIEAVIYLCSSLQSLHYYPYYAEVLLSSPLFTFTTMTDYSLYNTSIENSADHIPMAQVNLAADIGKLHQ